MSIAENLQFIRKQLPENVKLVAVSKTKSTGEILEAYHTGQLHFAENKVQEMTSKWQELPKEIQWHYIGHLQTNKVKTIAPFVALIHAVDSFKLLSTINGEAKKCSRVIPVLLQFYIASEETKFGLSLSEAEEMLSLPECREMKHISISGVMGMATFTDNQAQIKNEFQQLHRIFDILKEKYFPSNDQFREISMGMSDDYPIAVKEGSTLVRIGSLIFGSRSCYTGI